MARPIDADALIRNHGNDVTNWDNTYAVKISSIKNAPTLDAVEVVRCKDCVHYDGEGCLLTYGEFEPNSMDFCSYGERRNDG